MDLDPVGSKNTFLGTILVVNITGFNIFFYLFEFA